MDIKMALILVTVGIVMPLSSGAPAAPIMSDNMAAPRAVTILDISGTSGGQENNDGSQTAGDSGFASCGSFQAEGMGFEPTTPCGAPDFESGRWPVRLPSLSDSTGTSIYSSTAGLATLSRGGPVAANNALPRAANRRFGPPEQALSSNVIMALLCELIAMKWRSPSHHSRVEEQFVANQRAGNFDERGVVDTATPSTQPSA